MWRFYSVESIREIYHVVLIRKAQENLYSYSREDEGKPPNSIEFKHFYEVQKFGVSPIEEAILTVKVPTHIRQPNVKDIAIIGINDIIGIMNGYQFYCNHITNRSESFIASFEESKLTASSMALDLSRIADNNTNARTETNASMHVPSENRTLYINCSSDVVHCAQIDCILGPFVSSLSVARFLIILDLQLPNFPGKY